MAIYVDPLQTYGRTRWSHMMTDGDVEELHALAAKIGMKREWFQDKDPRYLHYDVQPNKRALAVSAGAIEISPEGLIRKCVWRGDKPS